MNNRIVGILTWREGRRFQEPDYFRRLIRAGKELGATVFLFSHEDVRVSERKIRGFVPAPGGGWASRWFPWPDVVIDRCRKRKEGYLAFRRRPLFLYANSTFHNKWTITRLLAAEDEVKRWIPATRPYTPEVLRQMLERHPIVYVKPGNGTGGRSILQIVRTNGGYRVSGRDRRLAHARFETGALPQLVRWVNRWVREQRIRNGTFMVQEGLDLALVPDHVVDVRLLIQKDGQGQWRVTGTGLRVGVKNSAVSNLHGGGRAVPFFPFMQQRFGAERAEAIHQECLTLAHKTAAVLERHFGRMVEFGLDIGVEVNGRIWLIEVNPKPGRDIFRRMGDRERFEQAIRRPLEYALYLAERQGRERAAAGSAHFSLE